MRGSDQPPGCLDSRISLARWRVMISRYGRRSGCVSKGRLWFARWVCAAVLHDVVPAQNFEEVPNIRSYRLDISAVCLGHLIDDLRSITSFIEQIKNL